ncbi:hypothetical protein EJ08DRAFT_690315 [Tothia fuscella]|uniref:U three protein 23 n=1 Tax=Tothia fuscella TaxID=1048955 RepID=A0A9P4NGU3_9PEZI|nr:hypothetical protein EJ08DRAFT_690315 [Tothia fuscella]
MRGKRSKQYRKLMHQYGLTFAFREPYQVLLDAEILQDAARFKMDLIGGLERTLHGQVKPMITQCSIRHLYNATPKDDSLIETAKSYERRRCNHHLLDDPLSTLDCLTSVIDPKGNSTNKHRYVVATQDGRLRAKMRQIPGVPLVYINRSVMIMEPMGGATEDLREREERAKFKSGLKDRRGATVLGKRGRDEDEEAGSAEEGVHPDRARNIATPVANVTTTATSEAAPKPKKRRGPKGANPLSMKKPKQRTAPTTTEVAEKPTKKPADIATAETEAKKKRKRKPRPKAEVTDVAGD